MFDFGRFHLIHFRFVAPLVLLAIISGVVFSQGAGDKALSPNQPSPAEMAEKAGVKLPRLPWHMADIWWEFASETKGFERLDVEVTIDRDIPDAFNLYVAPVGIARINNMDFYGGLQTNINGWQAKESRKRVHPGKGAIFSRWSADKSTPIGLGHVRMEEGGLCESAGYEGEFCSVRRPFTWTSGTYTYSIQKGKKETIEGKAHTWFDCVVTSQKDGAKTPIGSLRFEGNDFSFWARHAAFVEIYATEKIPQSGIPRCVVTFGYPRINGKGPELKSAFASYNPKGRAASPQCATARAEADKVVIEIGPITNREVAREPLGLKIPSP